MSGGYIGDSGLWGHKETGYASFLAAMGKCGRRLRYGGTVVHAVEHRIHAGQIKGTVVYARVGVICKMWRRWNAGAWTGTKGTDAW